MSDGLSDAAAVDDLAWEVRKAAKALKKALRDAKAGHRGLCPFYVEEANDVLGPYFRLQEKVQDERWR